MSYKEANSQPVMLTHIQRKLAMVLGGIVLITAIYAGIFGEMITYVQRPLFLCIIVICTVLIHPSKIFTEGGYAELALNIAVSCLAFIPTMYFITSWNDLVWDPYLNQWELILALALLASVFEAARRTTAKPLIFVAITFILYAKYGYVLPGILQHAGVSWENILRLTVLGTDGLFGTPLAFAAGFITVFVFFTAFLNASGAGGYLLDLANSVAGKWTGGPGKVAVLGSTFMGMVSGSGVTNVLTTGSITIPLMKRAGYPPHFAAGVEAVASQGSQFVPPILGAAVFLMAEYTSVPFLTLAGYCLVPAFLYYLSIIVQVHLRARRLGMDGADPATLPIFRIALVKSIIVFIPIIVLVAMLFLQATIAFSIVVSFFVLLLATSFKRETRIVTDRRKFSEALFEGTATLSSITAALALAGVVVGMILLTGFGGRISTLIINWSSGYLFVALLLTAMVSIILGMGVVTVGAYVIVASLTAPILVDFGLPLAVAHLFIFYYATLSGISPPVAVVVFAAAGIARASAMKSALSAMRLGFVAWLVPFMFSYHPSLLGIGGFSWEMVLHLGTSVVGVIAWGAAFEGFFLRRANLFQRCCFALGGTLLLFPGVVIAPIGLLIIAASAMLNKRMPLDAGIIRPV